MYYPINNNGSVRFLGSTGGIVFFDFSSNLWVMKKFGSPAAAITTSSYKSFMKGEEKVVRR